MLRAITFAVVALASSLAMSATHTVYYAAATSGTYYAYPVTQSLADWATYSVALSEGVGANIGRYTGTLDDANGATWYLFPSASQPTSWEDAVAVTTVIDKSNVVQVSDDATAADNLELAADNYSATRGLAGTALPAAAADAAGGLPISDAGGLDMDALATVVAAIGATGTGLSAIPWNAAWDAEVQSEVEDGLTAYDAATGVDVTSVIGSGVAGQGMKLYLETTKPDQPLARVIQGEAKTLTCIVEADGNFADDTPTAISAVVADQSGNRVAIANGSITRICEHAKFQVFQFTLSTSDTDGLSPGLANIEITIDSAKASLRQALFIEKKL